MIKHILLYIWVIVFFGIAVTIALISVLFGTPEYYDAVINIEVVVFFLIIPVIIIDLKLSSRHKIKEKVYEKDLELLQKETEIEALKKQRAEITEDDIIISKEKQTCLVHKGPIRGYSFICPECGAFYCIKCVDAIIVIENACWSCENPIDRSKPVKKVDAYEEEVIIEGESSVHKKQHKFCIYCGKKIDQKAKVCPYCGRDLKK